MLLQRFAVLRSRRTAVRLSRYLATNDAWRLPKRRPINGRSCPRFWRGGPASVVLHRCQIVAEAGGVVRAAPSFQGFETSGLCNQSH